MSDREPSEAERALQDIPDVQTVSDRPDGNGALTVHYTGKARKILEACEKTGEPIFIFRARDIFSTKVIALYGKEVEEFGPSNLDFQRDVAEQLQVFKDWQHANTNQVRYPD